MHWLCVGTRRHLTKFYCLQMSSRIILISLCIHSSVFFFSLALYSFCVRHWCIVTYHPLYNTQVRVDMDIYLSVCTLGPSIRLCRNFIAVALVQRKIERDRERKASIFCPHLTIVSRVVSPAVGTNPTRTVPRTRTQHTYTTLITIKWDFCSSADRFFYWIVCLCDDNVLSSLASNVVTIDLSSMENNLVFFEESWQWWGPIGRETRASARACTCICICCTMTGHNFWSMAQLQSMLATTAAHIHRSQVMIGKNYSHRPHSTLADTQQTVHAIVR